MPVNFRTQGSRTLTLTLVAAMTSGCTTISIETSDNAVKVEHRAGFAYVELPDRADTVADIRVVGFANTRLGAGIGFIHQKIATLGGDCRLVIWVEDPGQMEAARAIAADHPNICVINGEEEK